jgi:hypothetical protein
MERRMKQITCPHCADTYPDFDVAHVCSKGPYAPRLKPKMNERIRELMAEVGMSVDYLTNTKQIVLIEKFAELIVRECLAHGKSTQSQAVVNGSEEYNAGREMGIEVFMNQIKKHFGVEE